MNLLESCTVLNIERNVLITDIIFKKDGEERIKRLMVALAAFIKKINCNDVFFDDLMTMINCDVTSPDNLFYYLQISQRRILSLKFDNFMEIEIITPSLQFSNREILTSYEIKICLIDLATKLIEIKEGKEDFDIWHNPIITEESLSLTADENEKKIIDKYNDTQRTNPVIIECEIM